VKSRLESYARQVSCPVSSIASSGINNLALFGYHLGVKIYLGKDGRYYLASIENLFPCLPEHHTALHPQLIRKLAFPLSIR